MQSLPLEILYEILGDLTEKETYFLRVNNFFLRLVSNMKESDKYWYKKLKRDHQIYESVQNPKALYLLLDAKSTSYLASTFQVKFCINNQQWDYLILLLEKGIVEDEDVIAVYRYDTTFNPIHPKISSYIEKKCVKSRIYKYYPTAITFYFDCPTDYEITQMLIQVPPERFMSRFGLNADQYLNKIWKCEEHCLHENYIFVFVKYPEYLDNKNHFFELLKRTWEWISVSSATPILNKALKTNNSIQKLWVRFVDSVSKNELDREKVNVPNLRKACNKYGEMINKYSILHREVVRFLPEYYRR